MLWLALRFPYLPLQALGVDVKAEACLIASARHRVSSMTLCCEQQGVQLGMPVSTAQLLLECKVLERDLEQERQALSDICNMLYGFTPYLEVYCPAPKSDVSDQGVLLEVSRSLKLFRGEDKLLAELNKSLEQSAYDYVIGSARRGKSAWLASYQNKGEDWLHLPVSLLEEFPNKAEELQKMGFLQLADVHEQILKEGIHALQKRFGVDFIHYLQDVLGFDEGQADLFSRPLFQQALPVFEPEETYREHVSFDYPVSAIEHLQSPLQSMLQDLSAYMSTHQLQCFGVRWVFSDIYHNKEVFDVRCERVHRDWQRLLELSMIHLEQKGMPFEVDSIELRCSKFTEVSFSHNHLHFDRQPQRLLQNEALELTAARICARLGEDKVFKVSYVDEHLPELSHARKALYEACDEEVLSHHRYADRPAWVFNTPVAIGHNQNHLRWHGELQLIRGPERIEGHWWDEPSARDYFVAIRDDHIRVWVFNDLLKQGWFVQGVF
jgi:protein ImuB